MDRRYLIIAVIAAILFLLPSLAAEAALDTGINQTGNHTAFNVTSNSFTEVVGANLSLTSTAAGTYYGMFIAEVRTNWTGTQGQARVIMDGTTLGTYNLTSLSYFTTAPLFFAVPVSAGDHYLTVKMAVENVSAKQRIMYVSKWNMTVGFLRNFDVNSSAQIGVSQVTNLQGTLNGMNTTTAVNDTNINSTIAERTTEFRNNDTLIRDILNWANSTYLPNSTWNSNFPNTTFQGKIDSANASIASINSTKANKSDIGEFIGGTLGLDRIPATLTGKDADTVDGYHQNQDTRTTASPTFVTVNANVSGDNISVSRLTSSSGTVNASGTNFTNMSNLQAPASSIAALCSWDPTKVCIVNGTTRNLDYVGNNQTVIEAALASNKNMYLAEGVTYVPTGDTIPAYARITCSGNTSIIQPGNPTTTVLRMGAYSSIVNCGVKTANQAGMEASGTSSGDLRMAYNYFNNRNVTETMSWWPGKAFAVASGYYGLDQPAISCLLYGVGDCYWGGVNDTGVVFRVDINQVNSGESGKGLLIRNFGNGIGILINNSMGDYTKTGVGLEVDNFGANPGVLLTSSITTSGDVIRIVPKNVSGTGLDIRTETSKPVANLVKITANTNVTNNMLVTSATQQTGKIIQVYNSAAYEDDIIYLDMGRGSGSFSSGYFIRARNGAADKFLVNNDGSVTVSEFTRLNANTTAVCMVAGDDGKIYKNNTDGELYYCDGGVSEILSTP